ncbi:enoyl-CoA hydratase [Rhodobacteraceae bacterium NNCM2]|nr:enoyl-CoA hydratase [Coraliihabitans acroporae]
MAPLEAPAEPYLIREDADRIATLTLNRPNSLNALSVEMLSALQGEFDSLATDESIKAVVIRGAGRAFCAGHDLKQMTAARQSPDGGREAFTALFAQCARMMTSIRHLPQPVIAEVRGIAAAAGCQLVATCDMAVAAETTRFGVNGVNIGLFCSTPMVALSRNVPMKQAFEMLTTGDLIEAPRAREIGLINRAVPEEVLGQETRALAAQVASKLGYAVRVGKHGFYEQAEMTLDAAYAHTGRIITENMLHRDTAEGVAAFLEKRPPEWED